jgi:ribonucleoside-triphosphate reductase (thioredoxin)
MTLSNEILSDIITHMKYSRYWQHLQRRESWTELVSRNKEMHQRKYPLLSSEIESVYKFVYKKHILPSMRSMQFAGKPIEINNSRIYNCAFLPVDSHEAFSEIMFLLLGGTGVGYSVQRHHVDKLPPVKFPLKADGNYRTRRYLVADSIEGWADAVKVLVRAYLDPNKNALPIFDFSDIRPKGSRMITSGGKAPGPEPLKECLFNIQKMFERKAAGEKLTPLEVHDIICFIADAVLAGGIRRAALIALFSFDDEEMRTCKTGAWWELNPQRARANNSGVILRHRITKDKFEEIWDVIKNSGSGEPGIFFSNDKDWGGNPCLEISLRPFQFCNLVEVNVSDVEDQTDLNDRVRNAAFIATLQAGYTDFHYLRPIWKETTEKEALIGVGMTGIASGRILELDVEEAANVVKAENARVAAIIGINCAARTTTIKPSGTSSIVLGCSSGIHGWHSKYYVRRVRVGKNEAIYTYLSIYHPELVEDDYFKPSIQAVISVPQMAPDGAIYRDESALELLERVKLFNEKWVRAGHRGGQNYNNVSVTVSIKDHEWGEAGEWMWNNRSYYTGISVLPFDGGSYVQAPFEEISEETYHKMMESLKGVDLTKVIELDDNTDLTSEAACGGGACEVQ